MRGYIQDLKKAAQLVWRNQDRDYESCKCGLKIVNLIHATDLDAAIEDYAKPIEAQILDAEIDKSRPYKILKTEGSDVGTVHGLVVSGTDEYRSGSVADVSAWLVPVEKPEYADYIVTGAPTQDKDTWMQNSIRTVRTTIYRLYGIDLAKEYYVNISFIQQDAKSIDGPSAGITMTLAIMSMLGDPRIAKDERKPIPIRQDTAVTGTVENLGTGNDVKVGPIGGVYEKAWGAGKWGIKRVIIPKENADNAYFEVFHRSDVQVLNASTVMEYFDLIRES